MTLKQKKFGVLSRGSQEYEAGAQKQSEILNREWGVSNTEMAYDWHAA